MHRGMRIKIPMEQIPLAIESLTMQMRYNLGQYDMVLDLCDQNSDDKVYCENHDLKADQEAVLLPVRNRLMRDTRSSGFGESRGIGNPHNDPKVTDGYVLLCSIRRPYAYYQQLDFDVYYRTPPENGRYPIPECSMDDNGMTVELCPEQMAILKEAAEAFYATYHGELIKAFRFFTDDPVCLELVAAAEHLGKIQINPNYLGCVEKYWEWIRGVVKNDDLASV